MSDCPSCGETQQATAAFCTRCGVSMANATASTHADGATSSAAPRPLPGWVTADWPLAVIAASFLLGVLALGGAVWGLVSGVAANGFNPSGYLGAIAGLFLPFAAFGADTAVFGQAGDGSLVWVSGALSPSVLALVVLLVGAILRFGIRRVRTDRAFEAAFMAKFVFIATLAFGIVGAVVSIGDTDEGVSGDDFELVSTVGSGESTWVMLLVLGGISAAVFVRRHGPDLSSRWASWTKFSGSLAAGARWALLSVAALGLVASVLAVAVGDGTRERSAAAAVAPLVFGNLGTAGHAVAVGASDGVASGSEIDEVDRHLSYFNWGFPPQRDGDAAPPWAFALLLLAPAAAGLASWRRLQATRPTSGQDVFGALCMVAVGFAATHWILALLAPVRVLGVATEDFDGIFRAVEAAPSVGPVLGLSLVWGLAGAAVGAVLWARASDVSLVPASAGNGGGAFCSACGQPMSAVARFCPGCGEAATTSPTVGERQR